MSTSKAWLFLILAIATEVAGTLTMKESGHTGNVWMYVLMWLFIITSYSFLSLALKKIPIGIAIAMWEGIGVSFITIISFFILGEQVSTQKMIGLALAVTGMVFLHFGEDHGSETRSHTS